MKLFIKIGIICFSVTRLNAQHYSDLVRFFGDAKYSVSSERDFTYNISGEWITKPESGKVDKMVSNYSRNQNVEGFRSIRYLGESYEYIQHSVWDGKILQYQRNLKGTTVLFIKNSLEELDFPNRSANLITMPWAFLGLTAEVDLGRGQPISFTNETKARFLALLPLIEKGDFFELPYAPDLLCKVKLSELGSIDSVIIKTKDEDMVWSMKTTETKEFFREGGLHITLPSKITDTFKIKGAPTVKRDYKLLDLKFGNDADESILQIDATKTQFLYNKDSGEYLKINR